MYRKEVFLTICPGNKRDKATLLPIIKDKVQHFLNFMRLCLMIIKSGSPWYTHYYGWLGCVQDTG